MEEKKIQNEEVINTESFNVEEQAVDNVKKDEVFEETIVENDENVIAENVIEKKGIADQTAKKIVDEFLLQYEIDKEEIAKASLRLFSLETEIEKMKLKKESLEKETEALETECQTVKDNIAKAKRDEAITIAAITQKANIKAESITAEAERAAEKIKNDAKKENSKLSQELAEKRKGLETEKKALEEKEADAYLGFEKLFKEKKAQCEKEIQTLIQQSETLKKQIVSDEEKLKSEYETKKTQLEKEYLEERKKKFQELEAELKAQRDEIEKKSIENRKKEIELATRIQNVTERESSLATEKQTLLNRKTYLDDREKDIEELIEKRAEEKASRSEIEKESLRKTLNDYKNDYANLKRDNNTLIKKIQQSGPDSETLKIQNGTLTEERDYYKTEYEKLAKQNPKIDSIKAQGYDGLLKSYNDLKADYETLRTNFEKVSNEYAKKADDSEMLKFERNSKEQWKKTADELQDELNKKREVTREERMMAVTNGSPFSSDIDRKPIFKDGKPECCAESEWLKYIDEQSRECGIFFSEKLLKAYHTSVKIGEWSPLVVLAGVSGTGKSELPKRYATHGGMNFLSIPVKPDWDSPQSLFGFYNSLENKFEPTELLRALYKMSKDNRKSKQMLMVLLDEMNLAHVELYFSDLLSKFETNRGKKKTVEYEINLGAGAESEMLEIGKNVLWTGTMNEDETTKALSDKVVDRSTLITFPRPTKLIGRNGLKDAETEFVLTTDVWKGWLASALSTEDVDPDLMKDMQETVEKINEKMSDLGRNLGHRVWQGIQNYIVNHPDVISSKNNPEENKKAVQEAFSEAVAFKIMPKLRGVETSGEYGDKIDEIAKIISEKVPELLNDFNKARSLPSKIFMWHSAEFLGEPDKK